jgi:3-deoxy-manno-octulosonate cytidylyltransferase (CMP-KDO synthetase)
VGGGADRPQAPEFPLWFAVDHELCANASGQGFRAIMTDAGHQSGTDRIAEANRTVRARSVINVQADEPLVTGGQIRALARLIQGDWAPMATLATPFKRWWISTTQPGEGRDARDGRALYFSRSGCPFRATSG